MDYQQHFILDFARRTRANLLTIEAASDRDGVYEVTQLANSLLGLLVFPRERYMRSIPDTPLADLLELGWPAVLTTAGSLPHDTLRSLMQMLRNSIAHCNLEFYADDSGQISGLKLWNSRGNKRTWEAELSIDELRLIAMKFIELIESDSTTYREA